ncbi:uncharacterized protein LOC142050790 [Phalacrocorax aristotelis]|uniref:uncharacterized protein LOC142050790 n=1 Tax=Phalacrocorax aristotelis TaxID=126867 RepID=UPI003F4BDD32
MALRGLAVAFLLVLAPLLLAWGQKEPGPKTQRGAREAETCQRPWWDSRLRLAPDQENYKKDEEVMLSCPEGFQPSFTHIKCSSEVHSNSYGKPAYREVWHGRDSSGRWIRIQSDVRCMEVLQVLPGTLEISSTTIKLNWTCRLPDTCQHIWSRCRLEEPSSPPCEAEEVKGEEMLHGQEGTFTCPPLQPFTVYSVTISLPPSTILYTRLLRTKETVPDKPEKLWLDPSTGSLRWQALPSCKGEIIGYQLNITARRAHDGSFLEFKQVLVNQSVTQYTPPRQLPGSKYTVTVQGLTVAGAGAASLLEFQAYISGILWFVLSRKRKALPSKAEEDHYTELQPYENLDNYCVVKETLLAGKGGQAGQLLPQPLPVLESLEDSHSNEGEEMGWTSEAQC